MNESTKNLLIGLFIVICILKILDVLLNNNKKRKKARRKRTKNIKNEIVSAENYRKRQILTNNEMLFYKYLREIAKELNLIVLLKVRLADLLDVAKYNNNSEYYTYFGKIKAKHIDFALAKPEDLEIELIIELDDYTHSFKKNRENDEFKNNVLKETGYKLLRVYNADSLEYKIKNILNRNAE